MLISELLPSKDGGWGYKIITHTGEEHKAIRCLMDSLRMIHEAYTRDYPMGPETTLSPELPEVPQRDQ